MKTFKTALKANLIFFSCFIALFIFDDIGFRNINTGELIIALVLLIPRSIAFYAPIIFISPALFLWGMLTFYQSNKTVYPKLFLGSLAAAHLALVFIYAHFYNNFEISYEAATAFNQNNYSKIDAPTPIVIPPKKVQPAKPTADLSKAKIGTTTIAGNTPLPLNRSWEENIVYHHNRNVDLYRLYDMLGLPYHFGVRSDSYISKVSLSQKALIPLRIMWFKFRCRIQLEQNCLCQDLYTTSAQNPDQRNNINYYGTSLQYELIPSSAKLFYANYILVLILGFIVFYTLLNALTKSLLRKLKN